MKPNLSILRSVVAMSGLFFAACAHSAPEQTDFNEVSRQAAIMLQNKHFFREPFDEKMSERIFDKYLDTVDGGRLYLLKSDVDGFAEKYRKTLHVNVIEGSSIDVAEEIYAVVRERMSAREKEVSALLDKNSFTFDSDRKLARDRQKVGWAKDESEIQQVWANIVEGLMLSEDLRRSNIARLAKEQGKENPLKDERPAVESVKLKFKRDFAALKDVDREEIANFMISAVGAAYCPHTDYFSAREMDQFQMSISTQLSGIGAMLQAEEDGATKISGIVISGPSDQQGDLQLNDRIIGVDSLNDGKMVDIMFMPLSKVVEMIRGESGSEVKLKIEPAKNPANIMEIVIKRGSVEMKNDKAKGLIIDKKKGGQEKRIGVIDLPSFYADFQNLAGARCSVDVEKIVKRMVDEKVSGIYLDLRGNGGGSLDEVRRMTGLFVGNGPVVTVMDYLKRSRTYSSDAIPAIYDGPLVVAIDKTSASASEILAGALQDYNRAVIIGDYSSYGKGTVQQPFDLKKWLPVMGARDRAGFLKPTIQKFYRVAGSSTQLKGVESDIVLPSIYGGLEVGEKYLDFPLEHDMIEAAKGFKALDRSKLFIAQLKGASAARLESSVDYNYIKEDAEILDKRMKENFQSLNKEMRMKRIDEAEERTKTRNKERITRFKKIQEEDIKSMDVYRLELDDLENDELFKLDLTDIKDTHMRMAESDLDDLDQTPLWPSQMGVHRREGINILWDLVMLTEGQKLVKAEPVAK